MDETANTAANTIATLIKSPRMTVVSLLDAAFPNKITGAFIAAVTEDLQAPREARLWKAQAVDVVDR